MANKTAGDRILKHNGTSYDLRLDFRATAALESEYDVGITDFTLTKLASGSATILAYTLAQLIESGGGEISVEDAGQLVMDYGLFKSADKIASVFGATLRPEGSAKNPKAPAAN